MTKEQIQQYEQEIRRLEAENARLQRERDEAVNHRDDYETLWPQRRSSAAGSRRRYSGCGTRSNTPRNRP